MVKTTRLQREALKRVFDRCPIIENDRQITYCQFRKSVQPLFGGDGCILVKWAGMWLGIEPDGYTHS